MNPIMFLMLGLLGVILAFTLPTIIQKRRERLKPKRTWVTKHIEGRGGKFYFWDEAGLYSYGPFATFDECERELNKYAESLEPTL